MGTDPALCCAAARWAVLSYAPLGFAKPCLAALRFLAFAKLC